MGRSWREAVEEASQGMREGVMRALRFCTMESSIMPRETRRKSGGGGWLSVSELELGGGGGGDRPRSAVVLKQNWGVSLGWVGGCDILFFLSGVGGPGGAGGGGLLLIGGAQKSPATLKFDARSEMPSAFQGFICGLGPSYITLSSWISMGLLVRKTDRIKRSRTFGFPQVNRVITGTSRF